MSSQIEFALRGKDQGDTAAFLRPAMDDVLRRWPVSRDLNSPRHDRSDLLDAIGLPEQPRDEAEAGPDSA